MRTNTLLRTLISEIADTQPTLQALARQITAVRPDHMTKLTTADMAAFRLVSAAGVTSDVIADAIAVCRQGPRAAEWHKFDALASNAITAKKLQQLADVGASVQNFAIARVADDVATAASGIVKRLELLAAYGKAVTTLATMFTLLANNVENMHAKASSTEIQASMDLLDKLGIPYDAKRIDVDWTKH